MRKFRNFIFLTAMILVFIWAAAAAAADIVIGYSGPLSGPAAEYGQDCLNGVDMAINEINAKGGITVRGQSYNLRLVSMDDKVNPEIALNNARQLRKEHKAIAIYNPIFGSIAAMMKINEEKKNEFLIMAYTSVPKVTEMGNKLLIGATMPFTLFAKVEADLAWERGWRKGAMVVATGAYGEAWRKVFGEIWVKKGGVITVDKPANYYTRTDFAAPLAEALATNPDFLLIGGPSSTTALIIEQSRAKGFEGGFVMIDQAKLDAVYQVMEKPLLLEGAIGLAMFKDISYPTSAAFASNYKASYKRTLSWESVSNYTSMHALARAIAAANTADDVRAIRAAFPKAFPMLGNQYPMEIFGITPNGLVLAPSVVQTMKFGKFTQPKVYIWWAKTQKEFDKMKKISYINIPMIWKKIGND
jgi:branched-chain amino acid transport system substrate-binding protein